MRYLSKIILINSASVKYAEVNVDGNVHFIGTQGVGKSTLLRALLFFYNANQQKLGIPTGKKIFADFYFPYSDSYIIYEVTRETGSYCVMAFKSQNRVCFRFLDTAYDKRYFINTDGAAFSSWDKMKLNIGNAFSHTRKIDKFEEYRNILYGNNQAIGSEFKKYAILESKQYQNIPRAIQHVFLNYKVESEFIKDTIIKSLNEEDIKIDLVTYSSHLKDFEIELKDLKLWTEKNRSGEIIVRKQADNVIAIYLAYKHLEAEKRQLAKQIVWKLNDTKIQLPVLNKKFEDEDRKRLLAIERIKDLDSKFLAQKEKIQKELNLVEGKLKEIKKKQDEYAQMHVESIIVRVEKKQSIESDKEDLLQQKNILESQFADIKHRYEAQKNQLKNQHLQFQNSKEKEVNTAKEMLFETKEKISKTYEKLIDEIRQTHSDELQNARNNVEELRQEIERFERKKIEAKHKHFLEEELKVCTTNIAELKEKVRIAKAQIIHLKETESNIKTRWEIDKVRAEEIATNKKEKISEQIKNFNQKIVEIDNKIENSKNSLYSWLCSEYPNWENTIGKVIDEENVLFCKDLMPQKISDVNNSFFGIKIDLNQINKTVKTVADYEKEKAVLLDNIALHQQQISKINQELEAEIDNIKRRHQPKINDCKDTIITAEYNISQSQTKLSEAQVSFDDLTKRAKDEKQKTLDEIEQRIYQLNNDKLYADKDVTYIESDINKRIKDKQKEKDKKIDVENSKVSDLIAAITIEIKDRSTKCNIEIEELQKSQQLEMSAKGADTNQISIIQSKINKLNIELKFIDDNTSIVERYKYDKEQLFDNTELYKNQKQQSEKVLVNEQAKQNLQREKLNKELQALEEVISSIEKKLSEINEDLQAFEDFTLIDAYKLNDAFKSEPNREFESNKRCKLLIDEIKDVYYQSIERNKNLQEAINKFTGNFSPQNIFKFKTNLIEQAEYFQFAEDLKEFIQEDKIETFEKRVNERFADIIKRIGKETNDLLSKEGEIQNVISDINKDFAKRRFAGVIKEISLRVVQSKNTIIYLLTEIKKFNDDNINTLGEANLFSANEQTREAKNKKAVDFLTQLVKEINNYKNKEINLSDSFELEFKIVENDNDTNWVQNLANVGSDGTDVLVKAMINIMLLNVFKENATKNKSQDFKLHCMMDEIGKLHPNNVRGILKFANDRNINLINSSPQSFDALAYRYTYKLAKNEKSVTIINRLITNNREQ
jgi:hypothetical protein